VSARALSLLLSAALPALAAAQRSAPNGTPAAPREFRVDAGHSQVAFSVGFLGHPVRGRFDDVRGAIVYAAGRPESSSVTVVIGTRSVSTGSAHRDEHLRSDDFLDAAAHPHIVFTSRVVRRARGGFVATGPLTLHGVTREVTIPFRETAPPYEDPHGSTLLFFSGALRLARRDFGVLGGSKHNDWFDAARSATMADSVDVTLDVQAWDTDFARVHTYDEAVARVARDGVAAVLAAASSRASEWELGQLGRALLARGLTADALALFRRTTELFPRSAAAHTALARAHAAAGAPDSARASVARALEIDAADPWARELKRRLR
jgi:polyisoprenoid-binding protein YceI